MQQWPLKLQNNDHEIKDSEFIRAKRVRKSISKVLRFSDSDYFP